MKTRSHQRLITPPEGGSFRQLTLTRRKRENAKPITLLCTWGNTVVSRRPLPGKRLCIAFHGVNIAASIQTYAIQTQGKHPYGQVSRIMFKRPRALTRDTTVILYLQSTLEQMIFRTTWNTTWCLVEIFCSVTYSIPVPTALQYNQLLNRVTRNNTICPIQTSIEMIQRDREKCSHII